MKLTIDEPETEPLRRHVRGARMLASEIVLAEVPRAIRTNAASDISHIGRGMAALLAAIHITRLTRTVLLAAGLMDAPNLKALDAIHVASAVRIRQSLDGFITYDHRQAEAALAAGLVVESPA